MAHKKRLPDPELGVFEFLRRSYCSGIRVFAEIIKRTLRQIIEPRHYLSLETPPRTAYKKVQPFIRLGNRLRIGHAHGPELIILGQFQRGFAFIKGKLYGEKEIKFRSQFELIEGTAINKDTKARIENINLKGTIAGHNVDDIIIKMVNLLLCQILIVFSAKIQTPYCFNKLHG